MGTKRTLEASERGRDDALQVSRFSLTTRLTVALLLLAWVPLLISFSLQYRLVDRNLEEQGELQLAQLAEVQRRRVDRELEGMVNGLALVASRTQMRISLDEFGRSADEADKAFVQQILTDAADSAEHLVGGWVYDVSDQPVAKVGRVFRFPALQVFEQLPELAANRMGPYWVDDECERVIWTGTDLELDGRLIGRLVLAFGTQRLRSLLDDFPNPAIIGQSHIILERPDGARCVLSSTVANEEEDAAAALLSEEQILEISARMQPGEKLLSPFDDQQSTLIALTLRSASARLMVHSAPRMQQQLRTTMLAGYGGVLAALLALTTLFSYWVSTWISAPLKHLTKAVSSVRAGRNLPPMDIKRWPHEVLILAQALRDLTTAQRQFVTALRKENRQRRAAQSQLLDLANTDELTALANRRQFIHCLEQQAANPAAHAALLYMDLDRFKPVNDEHGHQVGDEVLKTVAERLINAVREQDVPARMGGDEFAVLLVDDEHWPQVEQIAERIEGSVAQSITVGDITVRVGCSIGAVKLTPGQSIHEAMKQADEAMYAVKQARKQGPGGS